MDCSIKIDGACRITDHHTTALLLTEEVADPDEEAGRLKTALIEFIKSGVFYEKLLAFGIFPGLIGVEVFSCCEVKRDSCCEIQAADETTWAGKTISSHLSTTKIADEDEDQEFEDEKEVKDFLPESFVVNVNVIVGIEGVDKQRKSITYPNGEPIYRGTDFATKEAQGHLMQLCDFESGLLRDQLGEEAFRELKVRKVRCFVSYFNDWLLAEELGGYPAGKEFSKLVRSWVLSPEGRKWKDYFGFVDDELAWVKIKVVTNLPRKSTAKAILRLMEHYDRVLEHRNAARPKPDLEAWPCSLSFVLAETEDAIINSTLWCAFISLTCALLSIIVFTASAVLAFTVVMTVAMVVACQAATMFVALGWEFGAVEAISLILFVGFSVDYTLHFAEAFHVSPPPKIENALSRVGRAIISAGTTTGGSAAFLLCCTV
jgi:hypothetical protein